MQARRNPRHWPAWSPWRLSCFRCRRQPRPLRAPAPNDACLMCHGDAGAKNAAGKSIGVDAKSFAGSVHGQMDFKCTDCHSDVSAEKLPHGPKLKPANCGSSRSGGEGIPVDRSRQGPRGRQHGRRDLQQLSRQSRHPEVERTRFAHNMLPVSTTTCASCHGNEALIEKAKLPGGNIVSQTTTAFTARRPMARVPGPREKRRPAPGAMVHTRFSARTIRPARREPGAHRADVWQLPPAGLQPFQRQPARPLRQAGNSAAPTSSIVTARTRSADATSKWQVAVIKECGNCHQDFIKSYRDTYQAR